MKSFKRVLLGNVLLFSILALSLGCSSDDNGGNNNTDDQQEFMGDSKVYNLRSFGDSGVTGTVTFNENQDGSTTIEFDLQNTTAGTQHPAHIHFNTAAEQGLVAISLGTVDGTSGEGSATVAALDDGTSISYDALVAFDGHINVHLSPTELATVLAQVDLGPNELTESSTTYTLESNTADEISGTITFYLRTNGEALATIELDNTIAGEEHPAHIHMNSVADGGAIAMELNSVDGTLGLSNTNIEFLDDGSSFRYVDVIAYNGHVNVHLSKSMLEVVVAQGNIGSN